MIVRVKDAKRADICDNLLTKLIQDERQYDESIDKSFVVKDFYNNVIKIDSNILLAYEEDEVIKGYIYLKPHFEDKNAYVVDALFVLEEYRNNGIAKSLFQEAIKMMKESSIKRLYIGVFVDNKKAYSLYKSLGFLDNKCTLKMDL